MEYCPGGDLFNLISCQREAKLKKTGENPAIILKCKNVQFYGACILLAIDYLHKNKIIFKDLKLENIIISKEGFPKLTDFGLSSSLDQDWIAETEPDFHAKSVTLSISSPEVLDSNSFSEASDWWSFGCLLYEMTVGKKPFDGLSFF